MSSSPTKTLLVGALLWIFGICAASAQAIDECELSARHVSTFEDMFDEGQFVDFGTVTVGPRFFRPGETFNGVIPGPTTRRWLGSLPAGGYRLRIDTAGWKTNQLRMVACLIYFEDGKRVDRLVSGKVEPGERVNLLFETDERAGLSIFLKGLGIGNVPYALTVLASIETGEIERKEEVLATGSFDAVSDCDEDSMASWDLVRNEYLGVTGWNPGFPGEVIGFTPARKPWLDGARVVWSPNWYPVSGRKETLCGDVVDYVHYSGSKENDLNHFIVPDAHFSHILEIPKQLFQSGWFAGAVFDAGAELKGGDHPAMSRGIFEWWDCEGTDDCVEVEITPPEAFLSTNPYFDERESNLEGRRICTYGPWVMEASHNRRPEIHPAELLWWKGEASQGDLEPYHLMVIQDSSERFALKKNYPRAARGGVQPWAEAPVAGRFWVTFSASPSAPLTLQIRDEESHHPVRWNRSWSLEGTSGAGWPVGEARDWPQIFALEGEPLLRLERWSEEDLETDLINVCRVPGTRTVRGYLALGAAAGLGADQDDTGYRVLKVTPRRGIEEGLVSQQLALTAAKAARDYSPVRVSAASLQRRGGQLTVDVRLPVRDRLGKIEGWETRPVPVFAQARSADVDSELLPPPVGLAPRLERSISALERAAQEMGERIDRRLPAPVGPSPIRSPSAVPVGPGSVGSRHDSAKWLALSESLGLGTTSPIGSFQSSLTVPLDVGIRYAPFRAGHPSTEDGSAVADRLNEAIQGMPAAGMQQLYGSAVPFEISWLFEARNVVTGKRVPVSLQGFPESTTSAQQAADRIGARSPAEILRSRQSKPDLSKVPITRPRFDPKNIRRTPEGRGVVVRAKEGGSSGLLESIEITFPSENDDDIFEVVASVSVSDSYGNRTRVERTFWSHQVQDAPEALREAARSLLGLDTIAPRSGDSGSGSHLERLRERPDARRARVFEALAEQSSVDGVLDLAELRGLARLRDDLLP